MLIIRVLRACDALGSGVSSMVEVAKTMLMISRTPPPPVALGESVA